MTTPAPDFSGVTTSTSASVLDDIAALVTVLREQKATVDQLTTALEQATSVHNRLVQVDIPAAMEAAGLTELKIKDGATLKVKDDVNVYVTVENRPAAYEWLRANGLGTIIKTDLVVDLRALTEEQRSSLLNTCHNDETEYNTTESVHAATLKSSVKDMLAKGFTMPPSISVHQYKKAELKEPRK